MMTKAELNDTKKALAQTLQEATVSQETALAYLRKMGLITKDGKLTKRYASARKD